MEKITDTPSAAKAHSGTYGKIVLNFSLGSAAELIGCLLFCRCRIFAAMFPLGLAFYGAVFSKKGWAVNFVTVFISTLVFCKSAAGVYLAALALATALMGILDADGSGFKKELVCSASFFVLKLVYFASGSLALYDIFALILETVIVFSGVYIFKKGFPTLVSIAARSYISTSEMLCAFAVIALAAMSLEGIKPVFGFTPSGVISVFMIYMFSLGGVNGGAVVLGVLLGTVGTFGSENFGTLAATYAFGALLASSLSHHGRVAAVLGFVIANTLSSLVLTDASAVAVSIYDSLGAAVLFFIMPQKLCGHLSGFFAGSDRGFYNSSAVIKRSREAVSSRLEQMSRSFHDLAAVYSGGTADRDLGKDYLRTKFSEVSAGVCASCPSRQVCFGKEGRNTYGHMSKMLETAMKSGKITAYTMPGEFRKKCRRADSFAEKFNSVFNVIKTERQWLSKLNDSRRLISSQLMAVSHALEKERAKCDLVIDRSLEDKLLSMLDKNGLYPADVIAQRQSDGGFSVGVTYVNRHLAARTADLTRQAVEAVMAAPVSAITPRYSGDKVTYSFCPSMSYSFSVGCASVPRNGQKVSGDSVNIVNTDGKTVYAMLSDGMGSGEAAKRESEDAICLMEKFLTAGFDVDTAIRLINSSLLLKSSRDSFSTIDLCSCDLVSGQITFTKLGAAASYIKSGDRITRVNASGLPAGILKDIDVENHYLSIDSDTTIILLSDGIGDIALKNKELEGWLEKELMSLDSSNPQIMASALMKKALRLQGDTAHDDMTIMVLMYKTGNMGK